MKNRFYLTTPIYYVNDVPHIGHAYTSIAADVIARFMRLEGREVMFLTGTDEHGQKVEKSALRMSVAPAEFTDRMSENFRRLITVLNIANDDFIRTTEPRHKEGVEKFWRKLVENGNIYLGKYEGWYSVRDEAFYEESELTADGLAPTGAPVEWVQEPSYFFALSKWQEPLLEFYQTHLDFIKPESRRNEVISFVKQGLRDLSVSRTSFGWGIRVPGAKEHVIYVWLDALTNYISALGYTYDGPNYQKFWPADVHIVGKDILRFHAVYWPAFLMAAGLEPPKTIMAHGWWTNEGQKISKSLGNVIDPFKLVQEFGVDQFRYFLMREITFGADGNYSRANLINRINSELANKIGNLMQRTLSFLEKHSNKRIPAVSANYIDKAYQLPLLLRARSMVTENSRLMAGLDISGVLNNILGLVEDGNIYIDKEAPWRLKAENPARMFEVLYVLVEVLRYIAVSLQPFVPASAELMLNQLGVPLTQRSFAYLTRDYAISPGSDIITPVPVFPRVTE